MRRNQQIIGADQGTTLLPVRADLAIVKRGFIREVDDLDVGQERCECCGIVSPAGYPRRRTAAPLW